MPIDTVKLLAEIPSPYRRDGLRWVVLESDPDDTGGTFLYFHESPESEAVFDEWYETLPQAKASAEERWGIGEAAWKGSSA